MSLFRWARRGALLVLAVSSTIGCRSAATGPESVQLDSAARYSDPSSDALRSRDRTAGAKLLPVSHTEPGEASEQPAGSEDPFEGASELSLDRLTAEVQRRNPSLQAALAAWSAASQRYPQAVSLDDPTFRSMFAPASFAPGSNVQPSYSLEFDQKLPWPGKRALRGEMARAEENAVSFDMQEVELRLSEATQLAFFDYYLAQRNLDLNRANEADVRKFRKTANVRYEASQVTQQDVLQADVELGRLESRQIELEQDRRIAMARMNTLLHRRPDAPLPPPPRTLGVSLASVSADELRERALRRPELAAKMSRIQSSRAAIELACKEYYPDVEFVGRYDQFWTDHEQQAQLGFNFNLPVNRSRRQAAVDEAVCNLRKLQAEYDQQLDDIQHDIEVARARLEASHRNVRLYADKIVPAARASVASADSGYAAGTVDFLRLIQAQRELLELLQKQQTAIAELHRHQAELERAIGQPLGQP